MFSIVPLLAQVDQISELGLPGHPLLKIIIIGALVVGFFFLPAPIKVLLLSALAKFGAWLVSFSVKEAPVVASGVKTVVVDVASGAQAVWTALYTAHQTALQNGNTAVAQTIVQALGQVSQPPAISAIPANVPPQPAVAQPTAAN